TMTPKELVKAFVNTQGALGKKTHLLIDEAQALTPTMLLELDELVNTPDIHGKLRVTLAGSPALRALLQDETLRVLRSPGHAIFEIPNLSFHDMSNYINKRLSIAGATRDIFSDTAKETIFYFSLGRPGLINMLCDLALAYGATDRQE
ncbi:AAA family ATPase, partial [Salmonella enterica]|uniref:AAA family ATPase n=1 Tax=Salmonella enterica TaxID=28901 RepID=UPI000D571106